MALELTVLNVLNGNFDLADIRIRRYVLDRLAKADKESRRVYTRFIYLTATRAIRKVLEDELVTKYRVDFIDRPFEMAEEAAHMAEEAAHMAEEAAHGEARMLLRLLAARGFEVPDGIRELVESCTDVALLDRWGDQAVTATALADIFDFALVSVA